MDVQDKFFYRMGGGGGGSGVGGGGRYDSDIEETFG